MRGPRAEFVSDIVNILVGSLRVRVTRTRDLDEREFLVRGFKGSEPTSNHL